MLQGKWIGEGDEIMEIDGLIVTTYYDDDDIYMSRIKIEDNYYHIKSFKEDLEVEYQILELTEKVFKYLYVESSTVWVYKKQN